MSRTGPHDQLPTVAEAYANEAQVLALAITRFIAAGCMTQNVACWDAGCQCAEEALGPAHAPRLVAAMIGVMRALRTERKQPWQFMTATCCRVTRDEIDLLRALSHARGSDRSTLMAATQSLTGGGASPQLIAALEAAVETLEAIKPMLAAPVLVRPATSSTRH
jgi:hypothetical protein